MQVIAPMPSEKASTPTAVASAPVKIVVAAAKPADSSAAGAAPAVANAWAKGNLTNQLKVRSFDCVLLTCAVANCDFS